MNYGWICHKIELLELSHPTYLSGGYPIHILQNQYRIIIGIINYNRKKNMVIPIEASINPIKSPLFTTIKPC